MKYLLTALFIISISATISAQTTGCVHGDCKDGYGKYVWSSGNEYIGNWKNSKFEGQGTIRYSNGDMYTGEFINGKQHGSGTYTWQNGTKYSGQWMNGYQHGEGTLYSTSATTTGVWQNGNYKGTTQEVTGCIFGDCDNGYGTYTWASGEKYTGNWSNKKRKGQGVNFFPTGEKFSGEWLDNRRHGYGTNTYTDGTSKSGMWEYDRYIGSSANNYGCISGDCDNGYGIYTWESGERYEGYWNNRKRYGKGKNIYASGAKYDGDWVNDKKHGVGLYSYPESSTYDNYYGDFDNDVMQGFGTLKWKDGKQYTGELKNNLFEGQGTMIYANGTTESGMWKNDKFMGSTETKTGCISGNCRDGFGTYISSVGNRYTGEFKNGYFHGQGTYTFAEGDQYKGQFKNGTYNGDGTYTFANGNVFTGSFENGTYNGIGTMFYTNGSTKTGLWKDGKYIGAQIDETDSPTIVEWFSPKAKQSEINESEATVVLCIKTKSELQNVQIFVNDVVRINHATRGYSVVQSNCDYTIERKIPLAEGENRIKAIVTVTSGETKSEEIIITRKTESKLLDEKRIALVIGNSNYPTAPLKNPVNDAKAIANKLNELGFEVYSFTNLDRNTMIREIRSFGNRLAAEKGVGLFYFAGHGLQLQGENYLVPIDANIGKEQDVELESVNLRRIMGEMEYASNEMNIVILDACRNNPFERSFRSSGGRGLASTSAPQGTFIAFATAPGSVASDGFGKNGLYTQELIKVLDEPKLTIEDVFKKVRVSVYELSEKQQVPWENSSIFRDFYFKP